jgi:uncharacterized repeat protein (TIGR03806 family)
LLRAFIPYKSGIYGAYMVHYCTSLSNLTSRLFVVWLLLLRSVWAGAPGLDSVTAVRPFLDEKFPFQARGYRVVDAFPYLRFRHPVRVQAIPGTSQMAVTGKEGQVWTFENQAATTAKQVLLDIRDRVQVTDNTGLVGLAFHPEWGVATSPNRGYFYVYYYYSPSPVVVGYNVQIQGYLRLSRFTRADGATTADPSSELVLVQQYDRHDWHGGGQMFFGNDGMLYWCNGDEGADDDFYNTAPFRNKGLNGGVFRIDVDNRADRSHAIRRQPIPAGTPPAGWPASFSANYMVPNDNPWMATDGSQLEEYWCLGLRSPHTLSYDATTNRIYCGDVGGLKREEIDHIEKGKNYQWAFREGDVAGPKSQPSPLVGPSTPPIHAYPRSEGNCVVCGPVYRGSQLGSELSGTLIFADHELGTVWALPLNPDGSAAGPPWVVSTTGSFGYTAGFHIGISSFGIDAAGEVYMAKMAGFEDLDPNGSGQIMKLAGSGTEALPVPATLSATGAFSNLATLTPHGSFVPYEPIEQFWSDGATKQRWISIPNDGQPNAANERISTTGQNWNYPFGTVVMKHFDIVLDERTPNVRTRLETRFLVHAVDGSWYGHTYRWRVDQSDADLVSASAGGTRGLTLINAAGTSRSQTWTFPTEAACFTCHNSATGTLLGLRQYALNSDLLYHRTNRVANQLHTLTSLGLLSPGYAEASLNSLPRMVSSGNFSAPLESRAKAYLDANCAYCHMPGGVNSQFDLRYTTPVSGMGIVNAFPVEDYGITDPRLIAPRNPTASVLHRRMNIVGTSGSLSQMPPLGKSVVDTQGSLTVQEWINTLDQSFWPGANGIQAEYFNNTTLTGPPILTRTDTQINNSWGTGAPGPGVNANNFSVRWTGRLKTATGTSVTPQNMDYRYIFTNGTAGAQPNSFKVQAAFMGQSRNNVWLSTTPHDELLGSNSFSGTYMPFVIEYRHFTGSATAQIQWRSSGIGSYVAIPANRFFLAGTQPEIPLAINDTYTVSKGGTLDMAVLGNDISGLALSPSTVTLVQAPKLGSATRNATTGNIAYSNNASIPGSRDTIIYNVKNSATNTSNRAIVTINILTASYTWLRSYFTAAEIENASVGGWYADPDGDGLTNLMEFASGSHPVDPSSGRRPVAQLVRSGVNSFAHVSFPRAVGNTSVSVAVETSSPLSGWAPDATAGILSTTDANNLPIYLVSLPITNGSAKKFCRLKFTLLE